MCDTRPAALMFLLCTAAASFLSFSVFLSFVRAQIAHACTQTETRTQVPGLPPVLYR